MFQEVWAGLINNRKNSRVDAVSYEEDEYVVIDQFEQNEWSEHQADVLMMPMPSITRMIRLHSFYTIQITSIGKAIRTETTVKISLCL